MKNDQYVQLIRRIANMVYLEGRQIHYTFIFSAAVIVALINDYYLISGLLFSIMLAYNIGREEIKSSDITLLLGGLTISLVGNVNSFLWLILLFVPVFIYRQFLTKSEEPFRFRAIPEMIYLLILLKAFFAL